jgi:hypothetical protein
VCALFTLKSTPVQVGGSYYGALQKACDKVAADGTVMAVSQDQPGDISLNKGISLNLKGGYDAGFSSNAGNVTEVNGTVSLSTGSMTVENIAISQSVPVPTAAPANIVATPGSGQVSLSWGAVLGATSYNVYYSTTTGVTRYNGTLRNGTSNPSLTVTGVTNGTTYYFVVTAVSANGESSESNQVIVAPILSAPPVPTGVTATAANGQVSVSWTPVTGADSYNIYYNSSSTGSTKITGASSPRVISLANNSTYWFVVTAVNTGGESAQSSPPVPATPVVPPATDLVGTWNFIRFAAGPDVPNGTVPGSVPGWMRGNATIATNGTVTINSIQDSSGGNIPPPVGSVAWTMNASGVVTQVGENALDNDNHGIMAANKQIIAGTGSLGSDRVIYVCVKQVPGVTFSNADLTGPLSFVLHQLNSGAEHKWQYGAGTVNSSRQVTITSFNGPNGPETRPPPNFSTLSVDSTGIVTATDNATTQGVITPDKKTMFVTETKGSNPYIFRVIQMAAPSYSQLDMGGTWRTHQLISSTSTPEWEYSTVSITNAGVLTTLEYLDSTGDNDPSGPSFTVHLASSGTITVDGSSTLNGTLSYNKNMAVITDTSDIGIGYYIMIILKQ